MSGVATIEAIYSAMDRIAAEMPTDASCQWGCPEGSHAVFKPIPDQTTEYVVYGFLGYTGAYLYIGQTRDLNWRLYQHGHAPWLYHAKEIHILATADTKREAQGLERRYIRELDPLCNVKHSPSNPEIHVA